MAQYAFNPITNRLDLTNTSSPGGDVVGPGSSTNNALVRWDGTTGTAIKNSNATLSDAGLLALAVALPTTSGGTGIATYTTGDILYASAANTLSKLPAAVDGQVLTLAAGIPSWSTATYPATTTINQILYSSAANTVTGLATANSSVLSTNSSGVPSLTTTLSLVSSTLVMLTLENTDASAVGAPIFELYRNSASPAANDTLGRIHFYGKDSGGAKQTYGIIQAVALSPSAGAETGALDFYATNAGADVMQMRLLNTGGQYRGNNTNTAPPAGYIGERIASAVAFGSPVSLPDATATNITSISLTAGIWDVTGIVAFSAAAITGTAFQASISSVSATLANAYGDGTVQTPYPPTSATANTLTIPAYRVTLSATTTYYLVAAGSYTVGTLTGYGRISAVRVG